uniref:Uncharacterized protein n=1 Tax=Romanomermis culicivorax TaxID=13658 RepID=A0A915I3Q8_ROMCU
MAKEVEKKDQAQAQLDGNQGQVRGEEGKKKKGLETLTPGLVPYDGRHKSNGLFYGIHSAQPTRSNQINGIAAPQAVDQWGGNREEMMPSQTLPHTELDQSMAEAESEENPLADAIRAKEAKAKANREAKARGDIIQEGLEEAIEVVGSSREIETPERDLHDRLDC